MTTQTEAQRVKFATPDAGTTIEFLKALALISARDTEWQSITSYQQRTLEKMQDDYDDRITELEAANAELLEALNWLDKWIGEKPLIECANRVRKAIAKHGGAA